MPKRASLMPTALAAFWFLLAAAVGHAQSAPPVSSQAPRHAIVIGNSGYVVAEKLDNPANDAALMSQTLKKLGFTVTTVLDADYVTMNRAIVTYANSLPAGAISFVFYAGHGVQVDGQNYLLPVDADPVSTSDLPFLSLSATQLMDIFKGRDTTANIFVLDACRNNPFSDGAARTIGGVSRGLALVSTGFQGNLIAYSTAPGQVAMDGDGENSPYTMALANSLKRPGLSIESVFKLARTQVIGQSDYQQIPWENSSLISDIYLAPEADEPGLNLTQCDMMAGHPSDPERVFAGIDYALMRPGPAIDACRADLLDDPDNPRLMTQLARALDKAGQYDEAIALNRRAINMGYLGAYHNLGNHYKKGAGVDRDLTRAFDLFLYAAERGHPEDAYNVGMILKDGTEATDPDPEAALLWFQRAADQDYPSAFDKLGLLYQEGSGVPQDDERAVALFQRGADLGDSSAMVNLATAYRKGQGVETDYVRAHDIYFRAAQLRRRSAYTNLGEIYLKGMGRAADPAEAVFWYTLAGRNGHAYSMQKALEIDADLTEAERSHIEQRIEEWITSDFG